MLSCISGLNISALHSKQHTQLNFMNDVVKRIKQLQWLFVKNDAWKGLIKPNLTLVFLRQLAMVVCNSKYSFMGSDAKVGLVDSLHVSELFGSSLSAITHCLKIYKKLIFKVEESFGTGRMRVCCVFFPKVSFAILCSSQRHFPCCCRLLERLSGSYSLSEPPILSVCS